MRTVIRVAGALILGAGAARAQDARFQFGHLTVESGLSNSWVRAIVRDSRGFLWVGTQDCLNRYDGTRFKQYCGRPRDAHGLLASAATAILEDSRRRLWIGAGALHLYDRDLDRFDRVILGGSETQPDAGVIRAIVEDRRGRLWLGTEGGLYRYDPADHASARFVHDPDVASSLSDSAVKDVLVDRQGRLWVATERGVDRLDAEGRGFERLFQATADPPVLRDDFEALYQDENGVVWLGGYALVRVDSVTGHATIVPHGLRPAHKPPRILTLRGDGVGHLFVGTENEGLLVLELGTGRLQRYTPDAEDPTSLGGSSIWAMARDGQGILWLGTFNAGLDYASPLIQRFGLVRARRGGLSDPHVSAILEDRLGRLWIGTDGGGLNQLDPATGHVTSYRADPRDPAALASDAVLSLFEDSQRRLWVGTYGGSLQLLDPVSGRFRSFRHVPGDPFARDHSVVWTITEDAGQVMVGTNRGPLRLDDQGGRLVEPADRPVGLSQAPTRSMAPDGRRGLWLGSGSQVEYLDRASGLVVRYPHAAGSGDGGTETVLALHLDTRGNLWIGSEGGGLSVLQAGSRTLRRYDSAAGLPSDWITSILEDGAGNLWLGTSRGLTEFEGGIHLPETPRFRVFDNHDGLQGLEFRVGAAFRSRRGEMFFGGQRGLTYFFPERIALNPDPPPVVLTELRVLGKSMAVGAPGSPLVKAVSETTELTLSHRQSALTFEFAALNLLLPQKNRYAYRLEGVDTGWNRVGTQHIARYGGLRPGSYVLHVRAANNDGVWNDEGLKLRIRIMPPLWERWWFQLLAALVLGALLLRTYQRRVAIGRREAEMIRRFAYEDALTGLPNRRLFDDRLAQVLIRAARYGKTVGVMFLDLDGLKLTNDTLGHAVGDEVLKRTAERLVGCLRVADTVARFGGDEFLVLLPQIGGAEDATKVAEKIVDALGRPHDIDGRQVQVTASIGVSLYPSDGSDGETLVGHADEALYRAKEQGRNRFAFYDPAAAGASTRCASPRLVGR